MTNSFLGKRNWKELIGRFSNSKSTYSNHLYETDTTRNVNNNIYKHFQANNNYHNEPYEVVTDKKQTIPKERKPYEKRKDNDDENRLTKTAKKYNTEKKNKAKLSRKKKEEMLLLKSKKKEKIPPRKYDPRTRAIIRIAEKFGVKKPWENLEKILGLNFVIKIQELENMFFNEDLVSKIRKNELSNVNILAQEFVESKKIQNDIFHMCYNGEDNPEIFKLKKFKKFLKDTKFCQDKHHLKNSGEEQPERKKSDNLNCSSDSESIENPEDNPIENRQEDMDSHDDSNQDNSHKENGPKI